MTWKLFLDDERYPANGEWDHTWTICRSLKEATQMCHLMGLPRYVSFDHDLSEGISVDGFENSGMGFARWMIEQCLEGHLTWPENFEWYVHSQNPVGAENINSLMENWKKSAGWFQNNGRE